MCQHQGLVVLEETEYLRDNDYMKITSEIRTKLNKKKDTKYKNFQAKLIPTVKPESIIGVRTPELKKLAREYIKDDKIENFLKDLPHKYFDENQLHAFLISEIKDGSICLKEINKFLPYVDNWATCDQLSPKALGKCKKDLLKNISMWIKSKKTYTIRFGIGMLMQYFLDEDFDKKYLSTVSKIKSKEYYVNMMIAWYFATALAKQYRYAIEYIEKNKLDPWVHNKTIQKAIESYRISPKQKTYLKSLRVAKE